MKALSETAREEFLAATHVAVLSVATTDGRPPASIPIWYEYSAGGDILISTTATSRKAKLIERAGAVTIVVQNEQPPYRYVVVEGTVVDTTTPTPMEMIESSAARYLGEAGGRAFVDEMAQIHEKTVLFTIRPDRWLTADFTEQP
jgi:PPOX class probable F420-dependent enzyme